MHLYKLTLIYVDLYFSVLLADVHHIKYGPFSERFGTYDCIYGTPWLCFSLHLDSRTVDLECSNENEV